MKENVSDFIVRHITFEQARSYTQAMLRGDANWRRSMVQFAKDVLS